MVNGPGEGGAEEVGGGVGGGGGCAWGDGLRWKGVGGSVARRSDRESSPVQSVALFTSQCNYWAAQASFGASRASARLRQKLVSYIH